jgi:hypothetical protein
MKKIMNHSYRLGIALAFGALVCEILSFAMFHGFLVQMYPICGSACEIWPGIPTSDVCILICVNRNGFYLPFFAAGLLLGAIGGIIIIKNKLSNPE